MLTTQHELEISDFNHILDTIADGVFMVNTEMQIVSYNRAAELLTGIPREKAIGKQCHQVFRTAVCFHACPIREAMANTAQVVSREIIMHDQDGEMVPVWVTASAVRDQNGNVIGGVESLRNLRRIYSIIDSVADGLFTVDQHLRITHFNKAAEDLTGLTHDEAIGKLCSEVFRTDLCQGNCPIREAMLTRQPIQRNVEIVDRSGRKKQLSIKASTLYDCTGKAIGGVETMRDLTPLYAIQEQIQEKYTFRSIVSRNAAMRRVFDVMEDIAASDVTVLLHGESGTGKELFAHAIHDLSPRRKKPLVTVNCGALPETLLESEIFGVRKGAYTGATESRPGRLEMCEGDTFFLDEIGDLPLQMQVKLLRVLENHEFQPLGARQPIRADVRFIAATNRNLAEMVEKGTFRADLFFRINIVALTIPPLRERRDDIPLLVDMALKRFNLTYHKFIRSVDPQVMQLLLHHPFPGNIRELLNIIEQSVIMARTDQITIDNLPSALTQTSPHVHTDSGDSHKKAKIGQQELHELFARHNGNKNDIAHALGIDRTTLWRWMKRYNIS